MVQGAVGKIGRLQNSRRENVVNVQQSSSSKHVPIQIALEVEAAKSLPNSGKLLPSCCTAAELDVKKPDGARWEEEKHHWQQI